MKATVYECEECGARTFSRWVHELLAVIWCTRCGRNTPHHADFDESEKER